MLHKRTALSLQLQVSCIYLYCPCSLPGCVGFSLLVHAMIGKHLQGHHMRHPKMEEGLQLNECGQVARKPCKLLGWVGTSFEEFFQMKSAESTGSVSAPASTIFPSFFCRQGHLL